MPTFSSLGQQKFLISQFLQVRDLGRAGSSGSRSRTRLQARCQLPLLAHLKAQLEKDPLRSSRAWFLQDSVPVGHCHRTTVLCYLRLSTGQFTAQQLASLQRNEQESERRWARQKPESFLRNLTMKVTVHHFEQILLLRSKSLRSRPCSREGDYTKARMQGAGLLKM